MALQRRRHEIPVRVAFMWQRSGRWRVRDRFACSLPVSTASSRDYGWSPMHLLDASYAQTKSDGEASRCVDGRPMWPAVTNTRVRSCASWP